VSSKTLAQIVDTEKATQALSEKYASKRENLLEDKNRKLNQMASEKETVLKEYQETQRAENQKALQAYKSEEKAKNDQEKLEIENQFQTALPTLVSLVTEEVKNSYGNR
jgi:hypothetical protein